jgi:hypothetical protein
MPMCSNTPLTGLAYVECVGMLHMEMHKLLKKTAIQLHHHRASGPSKGIQCVIRHTLDFEGLARSPLEPMMVKHMDCCHNMNSPKIIVNASANLCQSGTGMHEYPLEPSCGPLFHQNPQSGQKVSPQ